MPFLYAITEYIHTRTHDVVINTQAEAACVV